MQDGEQTLVLASTSDALASRATEAGIARRQAEAAVGNLVNKARELTRSPELIEIGVQSGCFRYLESDSSRKQRREV